MIKIKFSGNDFKGEKINGNESSKDIAELNEIEVDENISPICSIKNYFESREDTGNEIMNEESVSLDNESSDGAKSSAEDTEKVSYGSLFQ